jgi:hypothetical protein
MFRTMALVDLETTAVVPVAIVGTQFDNCQCLLVQQDMNDNKNVPTPGAVKKLFDTL